MSTVAPGLPASDRGANLGWIAGALVILAVFAIGAGFWFYYHP